VGGGGLGDKAPQPPQYQKIPPKPTYIFGMKELGGRGTEEKRRGGRRR